MNFFQLVTTGKSLVLDFRHRFRNSDSLQWLTVVECFFTNFGKLFWQLNGLQGVAIKECFVANSRNGLGETNCGHAVWFKRVVANTRNGVEVAVLSHWFGDNNFSCPGVGIEDGRSRSVFAAIPNGVNVKKGSMAFNVLNISKFWPWFCGFVGFNWLRRDE